MEVGSWDSLWGLLTVITLRKCSERAAYYRAQCRDVAREVSAPPAGEDAPPTADQERTFRAHITTSRDELCERPRDATGASAQPVCSHKTSSRLVARRVLLFTEQIRDLSVVSE